MEGEARLTPGAVQAIQDHLDGASTIQPVMQVLDVRLVNTSKNKNNQPAAADSAAANPQRYRMMLSDGAYTQQSMLSTALNVHVLDGTIRPGAILHLQDFMCNTVQGRRIIIVMKIDILQSECAMIGNPKVYVTTSTKEQEPNLPAHVAQTNSGTSGPSMMASSVSPSTEHADNNIPYGGPYNGGQGKLDPSVGRTLEPGPNNVLPGGAYGTIPMQNTILNANVVQPKFQQSLLNSHQSQRFPVHATGVGFGPPGNSFGHHGQARNQQPPPADMNRGPVAKNEATPRIVPISSLNLFQRTWAIKARVTAKSDLRQFTNSRGPGKRFFFDLLDSQGGEIRATCFNEAADKLFDQIEVSNVYLISGGVVKPAQKKYNPLNHDCEIQLNVFTSIEICSGDDSSIPSLQYNFRQINEIENMDDKAPVDLVGVVTSVSPSLTFMRKDGSESHRRNLQLVDTSGRSVQITLWGDFSDAEGQQLHLQCDSGLNPILALKSGRVNEYNGKSVGTSSTSQLKINPNFPEAERLRQWYMTEGRSVDYISLSRGSNTGRADVRKTIAQIKDENLGRSDKPDWIIVKAVISQVYTGPAESSFCYPACTLSFNGKPCNKKVTDNGDKTWHCDRCDQSSPACKYRYLLNCQIRDHTGTTYATAFQESGEQIVGRSAEELFSIKTVDQDHARFAEIVQGFQWHLFLLKLRVKEETYNDEQRVKCNIVNAEKLDPTEESCCVLREIDNLLLDGVGSAPGVNGAAGLNAGFANSGVGQNVLSSNNPYPVNMDGANQFGQQANIFGRISTPPPAAKNEQTCSVCGSSGHNAQNCPAAMDIQQPSPSAGVGFMGSSYGPSAGKTSSNLCFKCNQPGHWSRDCPVQTTAPKQQPYGHTAGLDVQQPPAGRSFMATSYGTSAGMANSDLCFKCFQPGHWAKDCPGQAAGLQQQTYGNGFASGFNR